MSWEIYQNRLRHMLVDITAEDDERPEAVKRSDWEGDIEVDGGGLVVTLCAGSQAES